MKGLWKTTLVAGLALAVLAVSVRAAAPVPADKTKKGDADIDKAFVLPPVFDKASPETVDDLRDMQKHVKQVIKKVRDAVVGIQIGGSSGSGVIIDQDGHVLTAGHVSGKPGQNCVIILRDGTRLKGKSLGQNVGIDSGLIKITDRGSLKGPLPVAPRGDSTKLKVSQWVLSIGHPGGFKPTRQPVVRLGRVLVSNASIIRTDCTLVGGDSGGPLFDMQGRVIGIHSRIGWSITENVHVPIQTYVETWDKLVKGESFGGWENFLNKGGAKPSPAYLGVVFERNASDLKIETVYEDTPADKAGLRAGDVIVGIDEASLKSRAELFDFMSKKKPDDEVTVRVKRGDDVIKVKVKLGKRPAD